MIRLIASIMSARSSGSIRSSRKARRGPARSPSDGIKGAPATKDTVEPAKAATQPPDNAAWALNIWRQAIDPRRTLVEEHLENRRLKLPDEAAVEAIRFHADCPFERERFPAMVCLVRNIISNKPQAIHRTALAADGTGIKRNGKTFRMSLGVIAGGAIKIDCNEDVTQGLCIGEGVETSLSGRQMGLRPVWSLVSVGGIENFQALPGVEGLHIFAENDTSGASAKAVEACARRWYEAGRNVIIVEPDTAKDLNDELRGAAR